MDESDSFHGMSTEPQVQTSPMLAWLWLGSFWLWLGMALSPVNARAWNPGKYFHQSLLLLYLPPLLWLCWQQRRRCVALLLYSGGGRWLTGLLLWAGIGLSWSTHGRAGDGLVILGGLLLFVLGTAVLVDVHGRAWWRLMFYAGLGLAAAALLAMLAFPFRQVVWEGAQRLVAFGTWNNPNLAGMGAGAAWLWLWLAPAPDARWRVARIAGLVLLLVFVLWTRSRGTWLGLLLALASLRLLRCRQSLWTGRSGGWLLLIPLALWAGWHQLFSRGWSYRPQIFMQALQHIAQSPWHGIGTLSRYQIWVGSQHWEHSHNVWTHVGILLGLPGLLLWAGLWLWTGWRAWQWRAQREGLGLLVLWIYALVATQFDAPQLFIQPDVEWALLWLPVGLALGLQLRQRPDWLAAARLG